MDKRAFSIIVGALVLSFVAGWLSRGFPSSPAVKVEAQAAAKQDSSSDNKAKAKQTAQLKCPDGATLIFTGEVDSDSSSRQSGESSAAASAEVKPSQADQDRFLLQAITKASSIGSQWGFAGSVRPLNAIPGWLGVELNTRREVMFSVGVSFK